MNSTMKNGFKKTCVAVVCSMTLLITACNDDDDDDFIGFNPVQTYAVDDEVKALVDRHDIFSYSMQSVRNKNIRATTLVFTPKGTPPAGGWPIVVWAHGTTGAADKCAPSRLPLTGEEKDLVMELVERGYAVIAPDYEGLGNNNEPHPYLHLESAANSILSAISEAKKYYGNVLADEWSIVGWSQGGHAALAAAEFSGALNNFDYKGAVAIAPASYLAETLNYGLGVAATVSAPGTPEAVQAAKQIAGTLYGYAAIVSSGIKAEKPAFQYSQAFLETKVPLAQIAEVECSPQVAEGFRTDIQSYIDNGGTYGTYQALQPNFILDDDVSTYLEENLPAQNPIPKPVYVFQGELDTTVPAHITATLLFPKLLEVAEEIDEDDLFLDPDANHQTIMTQNISAIVDKVEEFMNQ
ncbi:alpha/beta fold hydrolase [Acinetobacter sp. ASP199]|uniref:alpha/beta hydrolase n=1 Tax=unclassified Acinetobacter TaxID=196816 RepID=UPI001F6058A3|nr:alpha/beta fold hydrolase [Acinetobacter sp. ASP199]UNT60122.1 alpha/beta fold hydrolase [Acinetobacter sp. ASP199]